eukprot:CAMPEP_0172532582 /NCGR_PEP_ID=MMETSP1067-20121228/5580_1 /TAXON_ID=265564 ORGANISM="Thalassiosira punctigera, Strain Tpunct2005C2" /NCGR_SAMPLE_ID=MMETSP1067 /ASSEMBLY_ACC=CAM_ASM_000444 /LENGTH=125 /DNA_ID=CAMNT_0013317115 /DNA_START=17 /DNA_END=391 /DNA_ORIENTATION=+
MHVTEQYTSTRSLSDVSPANHRVQRSHARAVGLLIAARAVEAEHVQEPIEGRAGSTPAAVFALPLLQEEFDLLLEPATCDMVLTTWSLSEHWEPSRELLPMLSWKRLWPTTARVMRGGLSSEMTS